MRARWSTIIASVCLAAAMLAYLRDPPWLGRVTSGMRDWEEDPPGQRFRWTAGRASFFIPSEVTALRLPLRAFIPLTNGPITVDVSVDDRWLAKIELTDAQTWFQTTLPVSHRKTTRRYRRIDLHVSRVLPPYTLGIAVGEPTFESGRPPD